MVTEWRDTVDMRWMIADAFKSCRRLRRPDLEQQLSTSLHGDDRAPIWDALDSITSAITDAENQEPNV